MDCDIISNSGSVRILNVINDDFNGPSLNARWIWRDEGLFGNVYSFTANPGNIRLITAGETSYWCGVYTNLKLEQYVDKTKNFNIEVCINNSSLYLHEWGLLEFYIRGDSYISKLGIAEDSGKYSKPVHIRKD